MSYSWPVSPHDKAMVEAAAKQVIAKYGGVRSAGRATGILPSYLCHLKSGHHNNPGPKVLRQLGLRRITYLELMK